MNQSANQSNSKGIESERVNQPEPSLHELVTNRMSLLQVEDHHIHGISQADEARLEHYIDEIMQLIQAHKEAAEGVSILLKSDLAWCLGKLRGLGHPSEMLEVRHGITHPQAGEGEGK